MIYKATLTLLFLTMTGAAATDHNRPVDLSVSCNKHGAIVTVNSGIVAGNTYYLGKNCDAALKDGGTGRWWWAASAFIVEINGEGIRFSNDLGCDQLPYCKP